MRLLITGGSGFIGTNAIDQFSQQGHDISNYSLHPPLKPEHKQYWIAGDILDAGAFGDRLSRNFSRIGFCISPPGRSAMKIRRSKPAIESISTAPKMSSTPSGPPPRSSESSLLHPSSSAPLARCQQTTPTIFPKPFMAKARSLPNSSPGKPISRSAGRSSARPTSGDRGTCVTGASFGAWWNADSTFIPAVNR